MFRKPGITRPRGRLGPVGRFEGVPGWLGVVGAGDGRVPDALPTLAASVHDEEPGVDWTFVAPGEGFRLFDGAGATTGAFLGHTTVPLGCDDTATRMAAFSSERALQGDAVWVLRSGGPGAVPEVGSSRVDLQACKLEYSIVSPK